MMAPKLLLGVFPVFRGHEGQDQMEERGTEDNQGDRRLVAKAMSGEIAEAMRTLIKRRKDWRGCSSGCIAIVSRSRRNSIREGSVYWRLS